MIDKSVRDERFKLMRESKKLQDIKFDEKVSPEKAKKIVENQDKKYKKYKFYDNLIKEFEKQK